MLMLAEMVDEQGIIINAIIAKNFNMSPPQKEVGLISPR